MIVGNGDAMDEIKEYSKINKIDDKIILAGYIPNNKITEYLSASDIFWFIMKYPLPTYGLALQEAMCNSSIVIANNSGSMKEIIIDGVNGFLIDPEEKKIIKKINDILTNYSQDH